MALKGTLKDFPISDIFQLIGQQQKSGSLYIVNNDQVAHIMFDKGHLVLARFKQSNPELMIGNMLLKSGVITEEQLQEAVEDQQATLRSIGDILLSMKHITPETLKEFIKLQFKEVLFKVFQWKDGLYEFVAEQIKLNPKLISPQKPEQLLLDGYRMLDEWPAILKKIASLDAIYKPIVDASNLPPITDKKFPEEVSIDEEIDQAFSEFEGSSHEYSLDKHGEQFSKEERNILSAIDGWKTVKEVIEVSRLGTFDTCYHMAALLDKNAIIKLDATADSRVDPEALFQVDSTSKKQRIFRTALDLIVIGVICALLPFSVLYFKSRVISSPKTKDGFYLNVGTNPITNYIRLNKIEQIKFALELYKLKNDTYPESLQDLITEKLTVPDAVMGDVYYKKTSNKYKILP